MYVIYSDGIFKSRPKATIVLSCFLINSRALHDINRVAIMHFTHLFFEYLIKVYQFILTLCEIATTGQSRTQLDLRNKIFPLLYSYYNVLSWLQDEHSFYLNNQSGEEQSIWQLKMVWSSPRAKTELQNQLFPFPYVSY